MTDDFGAALADYKAAKRSGRFLRRRKGVPPAGASADWHYRSESDYLWMGEAARDMARNDAVIGQLVERAVISTLGTGFNVKPNTGDAGVDRELKARHDEESLDPDYCDLAGELSFHEQSKMVFRESLVPGDIFAVPMSDEYNGTIELREQHRCRSPSRPNKRNIVHGVQLDPRTRKRLAAYFTIENVEPHSSQRITLGDLRATPWRDEDGEANVLQVYNPKRSTQTRGTTALNPIFDLAGMLEDVNFAQLLKAQMAAFFMILRDRDKAFFEHNPQEPRLGTADPYDPVLENLRPGAQLRSAAGEKITPWTPNIPNPEYFPHVKLILTLLGINLGLPLVMVLMDASETNFSGWRGAIDLARQGFRDNQTMLKLRWYRPWWRLRVNYWANLDRSIAAALARSRPGGKIDVYRHQWNAPTWPYIEPTKDATADVIRDANMLTSPTRRCQERGDEWPDIVEEVIRDRSLAIGAAAKEAAKINKKYGLEGGLSVTWRDLAPLAMAERTSVSIKAGGDNPAEKATNERPGQTAA